MRVGVGEVIVGAIAGALIAMSVGCSSADVPTANPSAVSPPSVQVQHQLVPLGSELATGQAIDAYMGDDVGAALRVRVIDARGVPMAGVPVRMQWSGAGSVGDTVLQSDAHGVVAAPRWVLPVRDTMVVSSTARVWLERDASTSLTLTARAWRDLLHFGGDQVAVFRRLPVERTDIDAILPLGTFSGGDGLPSSAARLMLKATTSGTVFPMTRGLITQIDREAGTLTMRVTDDVRVQLSGVRVRDDRYVGQVVQTADTLGTVASGNHGSGNDAPELRIRVFDASITHSRFVRPERYGARTSAEFFGTYVVDSLRSHTFGLVRRAAPDLGGRFDYDRDGRLVGTWFEPGVDDVPLASLALPASGGSATFGRSEAERDPSADIAPFALTFAYDAERPGQVRIAVGGRLAAMLGIVGAYAVAWEDPDPATIDASHGVVVYGLFATEDEQRTQTGQRLLAQVMPDGRMRVEVQSDTHVPFAFTSRALVLVR